MKYPLRILSLLLFMLFFSCENNYFPKPKGFFRLDLPEKKYLLFDSLDLPYLFEIPEYAKIIPDTDIFAEPHWIDIKYLPFNASVHFSYKKIQKNLDVYLEDARLFVNKHIPKASLINERLYSDQQSNVHGIIFNIQGTGAASPIQFFLTDSVNHFVRGALYFNFTPNNDSLVPVIDYIRSDIEHLVETFEWRQ